MISNPPSTNSSEPSTSIVIKSILPLFKNSKLLLIIVSNFKPITSIGPFVDFELYLYNFYQYNNLYNVFYKNHLILYLMSINYLYN